MQVFRPCTAPEAIDLVAKLLKYMPEACFSAVKAMTHPFFDELRQEGDATSCRRVRTCYGLLLVLWLILFVASELSVRPDLICQLGPPHCEAELPCQLIDVN